MVSIPSTIIAITPGPKTKVGRGVEFGLPGVEVSGGAVLVDSVGTFVVGAAVEVPFEDIFGVVLFEVAFVGDRVVIGSVKYKIYMRYCYQTIPSKDVITFEI